MAKKISNKDIFEDGLFSPAVKNAEALNKELDKLEQGLKDIASVAISYNGDYVVALSHDTFIYLFNKSSSVPIWRYRLDGYPWPQYDYSLSISSDGKYIVAGGRHRIYLFDRDVINPPVLVIPGYSLFFIFFIIGITLSINLITIFRYTKKKSKETISIRKKPYDP